MAFKHRMDSDVSVANSTGQALLFQRLNGWRVCCVRRAHNSPDGELSEKPLKNRRAG